MIVLGLYRLGTSALVLPKSRATRLGLYRLGTSPRTRGKRGLCGIKAVGCNNIPAHAGKTATAAMGTGAAVEHPRARGENAKDTL